MAVFAPTKAGHPPCSWGLGAEHGPTRTQQKPVKPLGPSALGGSNPTGRLQIARRGARGLRGRRRRLLIASSAGVERASADNIATIAANLYSLAARAAELLVPGLFAVTMTGMNGSSCS